MLELAGKNGVAKVFTDIVDPATVAQIIGIMNQPVSMGSTVRIMPDCHAGKGCVVGTTMTVTDKIVPNIVGVDIGCGMLACRLNVSALTAEDLAAFDAAVRAAIPCGRDVRDTRHALARGQEPALAALRCRRLDLDRALYSIGTLGGGNHFIELDVDSQARVWLVIHSGSRYLGVQVAKYYQDQAMDERQANKPRRLELVRQLKKEGRTREIQAALQQAAMLPVAADMAFLLKGSGGYEDYLHDMQIVQAYAAANRTAIAQSICAAFTDHTPAVVAESFQTTHNYIDLEHGIVRKGAVSAQAGETLLIPMNMKFGSFLCRGKGNPDWNCSAPHGAGRVLSRSQAKAKLDLQQFRAEMDGVYSSTINEDTLDEAPLAYKPPEAIREAILDTVEILDTLRPIYNFKAGQ